jgi:hypothetical protein
MVVVGLSHNMSLQKQFAVAFFDEDRNLGGYLFSGCITASQEGKRMFVEET